MGSAKLIRSEINLKDIKDSDNGKNRFEVAAERKVKMINDIKFQLQKTIK